MYTASGRTRIALLNDTGGAWLAQNAFVVSHDTDTLGFVGFNNANPLSQIDNIGSFGARVRFVNTDNYTLSAIDFTVSVVGTRTVTLPTASDTSRRIYIVKNIGVGVVTVAGGSIEGVVDTTLVVLPKQSVILQSDGGTWLNLSKPAGVPTGQVSDEFTSTEGQITFTLTSTPLGSVSCFVSGSRVPKAAFSISGQTATYNPANNNNNVLTLGKRVNFDYVV
jgi:hypothetical protein